MKWIQRGGSRGVKWEGLTAAARLKVVADYFGGLCRKVVFAAVAAVYSPFLRQKPCRGLLSRAIM